MLSFSCSLTSNNPLMFFVLCLTVSIQTLFISLTESINNFLKSLDVDGFDEKILFGGINKLFFSKSKLSTPIINKSSIVKLDLYPKSVIAKQSCSRIVIPGS